MKLPDKFVRLFAIITITAIFAGASFICKATETANRYPAERSFNPQMVKLLHAIQKGDETSARRQLAAGLTLNTVDAETGVVTPLFWFILQRDKAAIRLAVKLGADPNFRDRDGNTIINQMAGSTLTDFLELLLQEGGDPRLLNGRKKPSLFAAVNIDSLENIKLLLKYGADINQTDASGMSAVLYAFFRGEIYGRYDLAYWLAEQGADIHNKDKDGFDLVREINDVIGQAQGAGLPVPEDVQKLKTLMEQQGVKFPPAKPRPMSEHWEFISP